MKRRSKVPKLNREHLRQIITNYEAGDADETLLRLINDMIKDQYNKLKDKTDDR